jgi:hypothetical protein
MARAGLTMNDLGYGSDSNSDASEQRWSSDSFTPQRQARVGPLAVWRAPDAVAVQPTTPAD